MDYEFEMLEEDGYVVAALGGIRTPETLITVAARTTAFCNERQIKRVLIDIKRMSRGLDTLETYEVAGHEIPRQESVRRALRAAILDRPENIERIRFFETVAVNRGLNVKVFADEDLAVEWLLTDAGNTAASRDRG